MSRQGCLRKGITGFMDAGRQGLAAAIRQQQSRLCQGGNGGGYMQRIGFALPAQRAPAQRRIDGGLSGMQGGNGSGLQYNPLPSGGARFLAQARRPGE